MNTKVYTLPAFLVALLGATQAADAQVAYESEAVSVTEFTCDNHTYYNSPWRNNWFIQLGAGVNQPFVETGIGTKSSLHAVDKTKMTAVYNFGFGRWFSPYLAIRVNALGGSLHWDNPIAGSSLGGWSRAKHANLNLELMWDMCNSLGGVNPDRIFSVIPYVGIGGDFAWNIHDSGDNLAAGSNIMEDNDVTRKSNSWTLPVSAGIQFRIRLCKAVDFFAEARASFYGDNWNNCAYGKPIDVNVAALGGFSFNINGREFGQYNECYYMSTIADLNNQVNDLRATVANDQAAIAALESQLPCPEVQETVVVNQSAPMLTNVRFTIDSDVITPQEEVNVYNVAEWLKNNPDQKIVVCGYADKDTGTSEYNMELSKKRADAVARQLTERYGINPSRITVDYDGSNVQPYPDNNDWNRIVIFTQQ